MPTYQVYMPDRVYNLLIEFSKEDDTTMKELMQSIIGNYIQERTSRKSKRA